MEATVVSIFGDSLAKGIVYDEGRGRYVILRENAVRRLEGVLPCPVENLSVMGYTVRQGEALLTPETLRAGGVAVIEYGGNDCDMPWKDIAERPEGEYDANTPLDAFRKMMGNLARRVRAAGMKPLFIVPPPLDAERYFAWVTRGLNAQNVLGWLGDVQHIYRWHERYALAVCDIARETRSRVIDLRDAFLSKRCPADYLCVDGIHPNERGHALIYDAVMDYLQIT